MNPSTEILEYLLQTHDILAQLDPWPLLNLKSKLDRAYRERGRIFFLGVGGSAANASHAAADFRTLCGFEAYAVMDNIASVTALTNDNGWHAMPWRWLEQSLLRTEDVLFILSVGGGSSQLSAGIIRAIGYAHSIGTTVVGIVGRDGGETLQQADACVVIPPLYPNRVTPHTEGIQSVLLHLLVSQLATHKAAWESQR